MGIKTNLNATPYFDDFDQNKELYQVLFRPGYAVQARELTTLQTILRNQIESFGSHMFSEGAQVIPGAISLDLEYHSVKLKGSFVTGESTDEYIMSLIGETVTAPSGVKAKIVNATVSTQTDSPTIFVKYESRGTSGEETFQNSAMNTLSNDILTIGSIDVSVLESSTVKCSEIGSASSVRSGVYFVRGMFIQCQDTTTIVSKYSNAPSVRIGFRVIENLISSDDDVTLLDNASGSTNYSAKGADRLQVKLSLTTIPLTSLDDVNFIELMRVENGSIRSSVTTTDYSIFEDTLARRTYDNSGDYSVERPSFDSREHINTGLNNGVYLSNAGGDSQKLAIGVSPLKAYVQGYEIQNESTTFIDLPKSREVKTVSGSSIPTSIGNYIITKDASGVPTIVGSSTIGGTYPPIQLQATHPALETYGVARVRDFELKNGEVDSTATPANSTFVSGYQHRLYLFDIQMFTKLVISSASGTLSDFYEVGERVKGQTSGATGFVYGQIGTANEINLVQVSGTFALAEVLELSTSSSTANLGSFDKRSIHQVRKVNQDIAGSFFDFIADIDTNLAETISGSISTTGTTVSGFATNFTSDLVVGDIISYPIAGGTEERTVSAITDDNTLTISASATTTTGVSAKRNRVKLDEQEELVQIFKLPSENTKTLIDGTSDTNVIVRETIEFSIDAGLTTGTCNIIGSSVSAEPVDITNYCAASFAGTAIPVESVSRFNSSTLTLGNFPQTATSSDKGKMLVTYKKTGVTPATKTYVQMGTKTVSKFQSGSTTQLNAYGEKPFDDEISLDYTDVLAIHAVYQSIDFDTVPTSPSLDIIIPISGQQPSIGDLITGASSSAIAKVISTGINTKIVMISGTFTVGEVFTYGDGSRDPVEISAVHVGDNNVLSSFLMDSGQRDSFYDIGRLVRKAGTIAPAGQLLIVYDYFTSSSDNFASVDSYNGIDYADIPRYTATRVDPEAPNPSGEYELRDCLDFRSHVVPNTSSTDNSFFFNNRVYTSGVQLPKSNSSVTTDYKSYLARVDHLYLGKDGAFKIQTGLSGEIPLPPAMLSDAMKLAEFTIPAYTYNAEDVSIVMTDNSRYTMRDIGKLDTRISTLEKITTLTMLENEVSRSYNFDSFGIDRFKSGFVVDSFSGHDIGDVAHIDYSCSIDSISGQLRPAVSVDYVPFVEVNVNDDQRNVSGYTKTGNVISMKYTEVPAIMQGYGSVKENINPFNIKSWIGHAELTPNSDSWFSDKFNPKVDTAKTSGRYSNIYQGRDDSINSIYSHWTKHWFGEKDSSRSLIENERIISRSITQDKVRVSGKFERPVTFESRKTFGDNTVDASIIQYVATKELSFSCSGLKPSTQLYAFFDSIDVTGNTVMVDNSATLKSDASGYISGTFTIPETEFKKFKTGVKIFRLTSSSTNSKIESVVDTSAEVEYYAIGTLNNSNSVYTSLQPLISKRMSTVPSTTRSSGAKTVGWNYPLAQTFKIDSADGVFLTSLDLYFTISSVESPVEISIRTVESGVPSTRALAYSCVSMGGSYINSSDDGSIATTFKFDSPVHIKDSVEYAIVISSQSSDYTVWTSKFGDLDETGTRTISRPSNVGVLYKYQNTGTRIPTVNEMLKFTLNKALFDTSINSKVSLVNEEVTSANGYTSGVKRNAIISEIGTNVIKVVQRNHGLTTTCTSEISGLEHSIGEEAVYDLSNTIAAVTITTAGSLITDGTYTIYPSVGTGADITLSVVGGIVTSAITGNIGKDYVAGVIAQSDLIASGIYPTGFANPVTLTISVATLTSTESNGVLVPLIPAKFAGIDLEYINKLHPAGSITGISMDSYEITLESAAGNADKSIVGGNNILSTKNVPFDIARFHVNALDFTGTSIKSSISPITSSSVSGSELTYVPIGSTDVSINEDYAIGKRCMVASRSSEIELLSGGSSLSSELILGSTSSDVSPMIDMSRIGLVAISNRIDKIDDVSDVPSMTEYNPSTVKFGDSNSAVYMTRKVTLAVPASSIKLNFLGAIMDGVVVEAYYKELRSDVNLAFDDIEWTAFNSTGMTDKPVIASRNLEDFLDYEYTTNTGNDFIAFSIKLVMKSSNSSKVPVIKDFRVIALA